MKAEPPALPCRDDVLVENGAAASKSCLSPFEMCSPIATGGLLPTSEASTQRRGPPLTSHLFGFTRPGRRILRRHQFNTPRTTAASGGITCLLPPLAGGSLKQSRRKIGCSILTVLRVVSTPARFWECGKRCFGEVLRLGAG